MLGFRAIQIAGYLAFAMILVASILRARREGGAGAWMSAGGAMLLMAFILANDLLCKPHTGASRIEGTVQVIMPPVWIHLNAIVRPVALLLYGVGMLLDRSTRRR